MAPASDEEIRQSIKDRMWGPSLGAGGANVIMQLSRLPVGHGVAKSTVDSGRVDKHPIKRLRTTSAFLVIALLGTDEERVALRNEINRAHREVHSGPDDEVAYNAFDPELQLWVAACLYMGVEDLYRFTEREPDLEWLHDSLYPYASRLGTTLQLPETMWPADRDAFETYWKDGLSTIEMDDLTRTYLRGIADLSFLVAPLGVLGRPLRPLLRPVGHLMTLGFLPPEFREELGLPWTDRQQRRFERLFGASIAIARRLPRVLREAPFNVYLWDTRRRIRRGQPIV
jgi:uncharacterized protein (DUF2236 family)